MRPNLYTRSLFSGALLLGAARADEFAPNHLFVSCVNSKAIVEFDEDGQFVRSIVPPGIDSPQSLAFGPNGLLYVTSFGTDELFEIRPDGVVSNKYDLGNNVGPNAVCVGPGGNLFVNGWLDHNMRRIEALDGPMHEHSSFPLITQSLSDFEFTSAGTFVGLAPNLNLLYEVNLQGNAVRSTTLNAAPVPAGIAIGPFDLVWYTSQGSKALARTHPYLTFIDSHPVADLIQPAGMVCGPNGDLFACWSGNDLVVMYSPLDFQVKGAIGFNVPALDGPYGIAFSPYRFKAKIKGRFGDETNGSEAIEDDVVLSVAPGSRTTMVHLKGGLGGSNLATKFFNHAFAFHGTESGQPGNKRLFSGVEVGVNPGVGTGRIDLDLKVGKVGDLDFVKVKKASGHIARSSSIGTFFGEITASDLLD